MKNALTKTIIGIFAISILAAYSPTKAVKNQQDDYTPQSFELYNSIAHMDSVFEDAYNNCKLDIMNSLLSEDLEFYHDQGGLSTSKDSTIDAYKRNICGKVNRELLKGSLEVYPINNYGAVEMGRHRFYSIEREKVNNNNYSKFYIYGKMKTDNGG